MADLACRTNGYMYDPKENWKGGDIARRQVVGYDMVKRLEGNALESLDKQVLFPTGISLPAATEGPLGAALCLTYNNWAANLVKGYEAAQELDIPLFCHPNGNWGFITERFTNFLAMHVLGRTK